MAHPSAPPAGSAEPLAGRGQSADTLTLGRRPDFSIPVPPGGYAWWYVDGISEDGRFGLTIIAFVGSVFSPYYAQARRRSTSADPEAHVALNVALYNPGGKAWAMTERTARDLERTPDQYRLRDSSVAWTGEELTIRIRERTAPGWRRLQGTVRLRPRLLQPDAFALAERDGHVWHPLAPEADLEVDLPAPGVRWRGSAYFDHNRGDAPLESAFRYWTWSRRHLDHGSEILYETHHRDGTTGLIAIHVGEDGRLSSFDAPARESLPTTGWGIARDTRIPGARVVRTLENTPFYARSLLATESGAVAVSENLDLDRFASRWVQTLLPFRMPRLSR